MITPEKLFAYADKFARRHENAGKGTVYPTMAQAAKRFRCKLSDVEDAANDYSGDGYMGIAVATGISGFGVGEFPCRSRYEVEAYAR